MRWMIENNKISIHYDDDEELEPSSKLVKRARRTNPDCEYFNGPNRLIPKVLKNCQEKIDNM
eukprot:10644591-Ditylum_brightwellii.AAC.1